MLRCKFIIGYNSIFYILNTAMRFTLYYLSSSSYHFHDIPHGFIDFALSTAQIFMDTFTIICKAAFFILSNNFILCFTEFLHCCRLEKASADHLNVIKKLIKGYCSNNCHYKICTENSPKYISYIFKSRSFKVINELLNPRQKNPCSQNRHNSPEHRCDKAYSSLKITWPGSIIPPAGMENLFHKYGCKILKYCTKNKTRKINSHSI